MKIIGIDPGYAIVGWGVIKYSSSDFLVLDYGAINTSPNIKFSKRLDIIYKELYNILAVYEPECMSIEKLFFSANK